MEGKTRCFGLGSLGPADPAALISGNAWLRSLLRDSADTRSRAGTQQQADGRRAHEPGVSTRGGVSGTEGATRGTGRAAWAGRNRQPVWLGKAGRLKEPFAPPERPWPPV